MIYLDYAANTPAQKNVLECFCRIENEYIGNPNSVHPAGIRAKERMEEATQMIARLLDAKPDEVIYTSGATESNNTAIKGIVQSSRHIGRHIISTPLEHSSVSGTLTALQEKDSEIDLLDIMRDGMVDCEQLEDLMTKHTVLISVCAIDSELGTIQPIDKIIEIKKKYPDCRLHVDATQAIGRIPFSFDGIDTMSLAPHKFGGLNGSGILLKREGVAMEPLLNGGASTTIYRSGTPALAMAVTSALALEMALAQEDEVNARISEYNHMLRKELSAYSRVQINSPKHSVPHILNLSVEGIKGTEFQKALAERDVCVSVKSACSVENTPSRSVFAISRDRKRALSSWRISMGSATTREEIEEFLNIFDSCYKELGNR